MKERRKKPDSIDSCYHWRAAVTTADFACALNFETSGSLVFFFSTATACRRWQHLRLHSPWLSSGLVPHTLQAGCMVTRFSLLVFCMQGVLWSWRSLFENLIIGMASPSGSVVTRNEIHRARSFFMLGSKCCAVTSIGRVSQYWQAHNTQHKSIQSVCPFLLVNLYPKREIIWSPDWATTDTSKSRKFLPNWIVGFGTRFLSVYTDIHVEFLYTLSPVGCAQRFCKHIAVLKRPSNIRIN